MTSPVIVTLGFYQAVYAFGSIFFPTEERLHKTFCAKFMENVSCKKVLAVMSTNLREIVPCNINIMHHVGRYCHNTVKGT